MYAASPRRLARMTVSRGLNWNAGIFAVRIFPACIAIGFSEASIKLARRLSWVISPVLPRRGYKAVLPFSASLPLGVVVRMSQTTELLVGNVGLLMILRVTVGVACAANASNMLEGFNGSGAGLGIIMATGLIVLAYLLGA